MKKMLTAILAAVLACACTTPAVIHRENHDMMVEFYREQAATLEIESAAFMELGRDYYMLQQAYVDAGNPRMAELAQGRAALFHQAHEALLDRQASAEAKLAELRRDPAAVVGREPGVRDTGELPPGAYAEPARPARRRPAPARQAPAQAPAQAAPPLAPLNAPPPVTPAEPAPIVEPAPIEVAPSAPAPAPVPAPKTSYLPQPPPAPAQPGSRAADEIPMPGVLPQERR